MSSEKLVMLGLGAVALYYFISKGTGTAAGGGQIQYCQFPDGTTVQVPLSSVCPYNAAHGGQSVFLSTATG